MRLSDAAESEPRLENFQVVENHRILKGRRKLRVSELEFSPCARLTYHSIIKVVKKKMHIMWKSHHEVEQTPKLLEGVLNRGPGEEEAVLTIMKKDEAFFN